MRRFLALFSSVLLCGLCLIGSCLPVSAVDEPATMLYNGVELPNIDSVWTDKEKYPYAVVFSTPRVAYKGGYRLILSSKPYFSCDGCLARIHEYHLYIEYDCLLGGVTWDYENISSHISGQTLKLYKFSEYPLYWASYDILNDDGTIYLAASSPVDPNAPPAPTGNIEVVSSQVLDDSASFVLNVSDLTDTTAAYTVKVSRYIGDTLDGEFLSEAFAGPSATLHLTAANLAPETEYRMEFMLQYNGEDTEITAETTITTLAGEGEVLPDYSGQLGEIQESLGDVQEGIGAVKDSVDGVKDSVDGVQEAVTDVKEEVASLPGKIASTIADMLIGLIVPSEEDLVHLRDSYEDMLSEKLGFVWQSYDLTTTTVSSIHDGMEGSDVYEFVFPGVSFPMGDETITLVEETVVSMDNDFMDVVRPVCGTAVCFVAVISFLNMAYDMLIAIISGISMWEFHKRHQYDIADASAGGSSSYSEGGYW